MPPIEPTETINHAAMHEHADELSGMLLTFPSEATTTVTFGRGAEQVYANRDAILEYESDCNWQPGDTEGECVWRVVVIDPTTGVPITEAAGSVSTRPGDVIEVWA